MHFTFLKKILVTLVVFSMLPLLISGYHAYSRMKLVKQSAVDKGREALVANAAALLEDRAHTIARQVELFLQECANDLQVLFLIPADPSAYMRFSRSHMRQIRIRTGPHTHPVEEMSVIPLYRQVAFVDADGFERVHIEDDRIVMERQDLSKPFRGRFGEEDYFNKTRSLSHGQIYVSRLLGRHLRKDGQLQDAKDVEAAIGGRIYQGIIRMAAPVFQNSRFKGVVSLAVDHRHLMEFTQHILPVGKQSEVFPSYASGNYAFMFDDQGWMISHPKFWNIRGHELASGGLVDPASPGYSEQIIQAGQVPFNLLYVPFIDPNYRHMVLEVLAGRSGVTHTTNVEGVSRVVTYAPIRFSMGVYQKAGHFGGVALGAQTDYFYKSIDRRISQIDNALDITTLNLTIFILIAGALSGIAAVLLARHFKRSITKLSHKAKEISRGQFNHSVRIESGDEFEILGRDFEEMAHKIEKRQQGLIDTLGELQASNKVIEASREQLKDQLSILNHVHYITHSLGTNFDKQKALSIILDICVAGLGFERAMVYLFNPEKSQLECIKTFGFDAKSRRQILTSTYRPGKDDCIPAKVFASGLPKREKGMQHTPGLQDGYRTPSSSEDRNFSYVYMPIQVANRIIGVLGVGHDAGRQRMSEEEMGFLKIVANETGIAIEKVGLMAEALKRREKRREFIENIFLNMMSGLIIIDPSRLINSVNNYAEKVLEISNYDTLGLTIDEAFIAQQELLALIDQAIRSRQSLNSELKLSFPPDNFKYIDMTISYIEGTGLSRRDSILLSFMDITERKKLEAHVRRSDRLVSLGTLAAGVAHEIRNPLTGISILMDDLHDRLVDQAGARETLKRTLMEIDKFENLVVGLLDFSAPHTSKMAANSIHSIIEQTLFMVKKQYTRKGNELIYNKPDKLPLLWVNPERIKQALLNIILNSLNVLSEGGKTSIHTYLRDTIQCLSGKKGIEVRITDNGPGIKPEDIEYIFDPFFSRTSDGTGLGLSIAHSIIEEHNGKIFVESQPGHGATFKIYLPLMDEENGKDPDHRRRVHHSR